jgi:hypothetical protein
MDDKYKPFVSPKNRCSPSLEHGHSGDPRPVKEVEVQEKSTTNDALVAKRNLTTTSVEVVKSHAPAVALKKNVTMAKVGDGSPANPKDTPPAQTSNEKTQTAETSVEGVKTHAPAVALKKNDTMAKVGDGSLANPKDTPPAQTSDEKTQTAEEFQAMILLKRQKRDEQLLFDQKERERVNQERIELERINAEKRRFEMESERLKAVEDEKRLKADQEEQERQKVESEKAAAAASAKTKEEKEMSAIYSMQDDPVLQKYMNMVKERKLNVFTSNSVVQHSSKYNDECTQIRNFRAETKRSIG